jgi:large subunit ribosomal protein L13
MLLAQRRWRRATRRPACAWLRRRCVLAAPLRLLRAPRTAKAGRVTAGRPTDAPRRTQRSSRTAPRATLTVAAAAAPTVEKLGADIWNTTYYPKGVDHVATEKTWYLIDAKGQRLGRMAVLIAQYLRGANKASYTPSQDMGSYVVVINAEQVAVTGRKAEQKMYVRHTTGRPGGHVVESFQALQKRIPTRIVEEAVWGMIPKERLGRRLFTHLKCYKGAEHPHAAQQPVDITHLVCMPKKA